MSTSGKIHDIGTQIFGFLLSAATSYTLMQDVAIKGVLAIMTGFLGGFAALAGKILAQKMLDRFKKK